MQITSTAAANILEPTKRLPHAAENAGVRPSATKNNPHVRPAERLQTVVATPAVETAETTPAAPGSCGTAGPGLCTQFDPTHLQDLMNSWGQNNSAYDYDGNGTVNVNDMLQFVGQMQPAEPTILIKPANPEIALAPDPSAAEAAPVTVSTEEVFPEPAPTTTVPPSTSDPASPVDSTPTLDGLMAAWGTADTQYDLNSDGTVNINDMLSFIGNLPAGSAAQTTAEAAARARAAYVANLPGLATPEGKGLGGVHKLADNLVDRLMAAGFDKQPPANIHELVDNFNLSTKQNDFLLKTLEAKYPAGLGVDVEA